MAEAPTAQSPPGLLTGDAQGRIPELDGLRGLAILLVLLWHYLGVQLQPGPGDGALDLLKRSLALTWSGVDLFFVLSGFLIGGILLDHRRARGYFAAFYLRRAGRIFPIYYVWLAIYLLACSSDPISHRFPWLFFGDERFPDWSYALYVQNFFVASRSHFGPSWLAVTWSLAVEEQFYLLLPVLVHLLPPRRLVQLLVILILSTPLVRWLLLQQAGGLSCYVLLPARWDSLFMGVVLAWWTRQPGAALWARAHLGVLQGCCLLLVASLVGLTVASPWIVSPFMCTLGYSVIAAAYTASLLLILLQREGALGRVMRWAPLGRLGVISYGVYILHQPISGLCHGLLRSHTYARPSEPKILSGGDALVTSLALLITVVLALISYRWFERPLLRLVHRRRYGPPPEEVARAADS